MAQIASRREVVQIEQISARAEYTAIRMRVAIHRTRGVPGRLLWRSQCSRRDDLIGVDHPLSPGGSALYR